MITDYIAYSVVIWASIAIVIRVYKLFTKKSTCDGCSCSSSKKTADVIPLEMRFATKVTNKASNNNIN